MHLRNRDIVGILDKKRRAFPLVGVLGARQVGKSTLLRELYGIKEKMPYLTFDRAEILREARERPENFILVHTEEFQRPIIIDEAHKAPEIFDALKVLADERKNRGIVFLTGSVDFVQAAGARETLTGRLGVCRLFPLTASELAERVGSNSWRYISKFMLPEVPSQRARSIEVEQWLTRGGMPAICKIGDKSERDLLIDEWLQSICYRDLLQLKGARYDGALAREILRLIAIDPEISQGALASALGEDGRRVAKHLSGLEALFVIYRIRPFRQSGAVGFDRFRILDCAVANFFGGPKELGYEIFVINEILAQHENRALGKPELYYYASRRKTRVNLVVKSGATVTPLVISARDSLTRSQLLGARAALKQGVFQNITVFAPISQPQSIDKNIRALPYNSLIE